MAALRSFNVTPHNAHYDGGYDERMIRWRQLGEIDKAANIKALVGPRNAEVRSVLEVRCGTGAVLAEVIKTGIGQTHVGVDMADPNVHVDPTGVGLDLREFNGNTLPFDTSSFDLVYASHVLEHVPDERGFLSEIARVAGKFIYIEVPCELHLRTTPALLQTC